jgi:hypothetical protein
VKMAALENEIPMSRAVEEPIREWLGKKDARLIAQVREAGWLCCDLRGDPISAYVVCCCSGTAPPPAHRCYGCGRCYRSDGIAARLSTGFSHSAHAGADRIRAGR